jgi:hypothetical protein
MVQYERLRGASEDLGREKLRLEGMRLEHRMDFEEIFRSEEQKIMTREQLNYSKTLHRVEESLLCEERNRRHLSLKHEEVDVTLCAKRNDLLGRMGAVGKFFFFG